MDWLDAGTVFVLGWLGEKLKRLAKAALDVIWFLIWCTSTVRCLVVMSVYTAFIQAATALRKSGHLNGTTMKATGRFISWASPKLDAWIERTGPGTPAWRDTMVRLERKATRKKAAAP